MCTFVAHYDAQIYLFFVISPQHTDGCSPQVYEKVMHTYAYDCGDVRESVCVCVCVCVCVYVPMIIYAASHLHTCRCV